MNRLNSNFPRILIELTCKGSHWGQQRVLQFGFPFGWSCQDATEERSPGPMTRDIYFDIYIEIYIWDNFLCEFDEDLYLVVSQQTVNFLPNSVVVKGEPGLYCINHEYLYLNTELFSDWNPQYSWSLEKVTLYTCTLIITHRAPGACSDMIGLWSLLDAGCTLVFKKIFVWYIRSSSKVFLRDLVCKCEDSWDPSDDMITANFSFPLWNQQILDSGKEVKLVSFLAHIVCTCRCGDSGYPSDAMITADVLCGLFLFPSIHLLFSWIVTLFNFPCEQISEKSFTLAMFNFLFFCTSPIMIACACKCGVWISLWWYDHWSEYPSFSPPIPLIVSQSRLSHFLSYFLKLDYRFVYKCMTVNCVRIYTLNTLYRGWIGTSGE